MSAHQKVQLGEIATISSGGTPSRSKPNYWGGKIPWVKTTQIQNCWIYERDVDEWITEEGLLNSSAKMYSKGTLLMAMYGQGKTRGQVAILGLDATINQACAAIELDAKAADRDFIFQQFLFKYETIRGMSNAGGQDNLSAGIIREIAVLLPPLPEQKAIADTLSTWDSAITTMERLIAAKERRLNGLGQQITLGAQNSSNTKWRKVHLHEVLKEHGDLSTGKEPVYSVSVHKGLVDQIEHLGRSFSAASTDHYNRVHHGDLVYTKSPTGDFPLGIIKQSLAGRDVIVSPLYGVFTPATFELGVIMDFLFSSPITTRNYLAPLVQKGAKNTISITNQGFLQGELWLPLDRKEQQSVCELIQIARTEIHEIKQELELLKRQKRGLMQKLLTGNWRVKIPQEAA